MRSRVVHGGLVQMRAATEVPNPQEKPTLLAGETAPLFGVSEWTLRESVRNGTCPIQPVRFGRRYVWVTARVLDFLGLAQP
jgi:hypothetical protein